MRTCQEYGPKRISEKKKGFKGYVHAIRPDTVKFQK